MAQVDDELAIREGLAEMTAQQPSPSAGRFAEVRRRAILRRRRQLAGAAVAVAVLVAAGIAIPLGLVGAVHPAPSGPRQYHVSERPPGPGAEHGLIATGEINGFHWKLSVRLLSPGVTGYCFSSGTGPNDSVCLEDKTPVDLSGSPVFFETAVGSRYPIEIGVVQERVARLTVGFSNGQSLTVRPVDALGSGHGRFVAVAVPYTAAVTKVTAYTRDAEIGYAVPFTRGRSFNFYQWLRPGQPALPRPAAFEIGSGIARGSRWREYAYVGPWGVCFAGTAGLSCTALDYLAPHQVAAGVGSTAGTDSTWYVFGEAAPQVSYLILTTSSHHTEKVTPVSAGPWKFYAYASIPGDRVIRWAARGSAGRTLATGLGQVP